MARSRLRADALDRNDSFSFANVTIDGYSGEELNDGYLAGIVLKNGPEGPNTLTLFAADGGIQQDGTGPVSFSGNVEAKGDVLIRGSLAILGSSTEIETQKLLVSDPISVLNVGGSQLLSKWTGLSMQASDGYHQMGWDFDGYFGISVGAGTAGSDAVPTRAVAFVGSNYTDGDLSAAGSHSAAGAHKIGVWPTGNLASSNVQDALQELQSDVDALSAGDITVASGTTSPSWTIHKVDDPLTQVNACLIEHGGNGLGNEIDGYLCTITDPTQPYRMQMKLFEDGLLINSRLDIGELDAINNLTSSLFLNAGDGYNAKQANLTLSGNGTLDYTATKHSFSGPVEATGDLQVDGGLKAYGDTTIGNSSSDKLSVAALVASDLLPEDNAHLLGDASHRWVDGYFTMFSPSHYTPVGSNYSLTGHLKGIDSLLGSVTHFKHGTYIITVPEGSSDTLDSSRVVNQGIQSDVGSLSDSDFCNHTSIYIDGQLLLNDIATRANNGAVVNDVARDSSNPSLLRFNRNIKKGSIVQIEITV